MFWAERAVDSILAAHDAAGGHLALRYHLLIDTHVDSNRMLELPRGRYSRASAERVLHWVEDLEAPLTELMTELVDGAKGKVKHCMVVLLWPFMLSHVGRVIVLDTDLVVVSDMRYLWRRFETFGSEQIVALAEEQQPIPAYVNHLAYPGLNGGVVLPCCSTSNARGARCSTRNGSARPRPPRRRSGSGSTTTSSLGSGSATKTGTCEDCW